MSAAHPETGRGIRTPFRDVPSGVPILQVLIRSALVALVAVSFPIHAFDFDDVGRRAAVLASRSYEAPPQDLPKALRELSYDAYRDIRFKPSRALWRGMNLPFEVQMFHRGMHYDQAVRISEIVAGVPREIRFDPELFDYGSNRFDPAQTRGAGFAGFRVHFALNTPKYKDEVLVFLRASYFRALGKDQRYGISARGLAIDTALASGDRRKPRVPQRSDRRNAAAATHHATRRQETGRDPRLPPYVGRRGDADMELHRAPGMMNADGHGPK
jgi:glucans biosynthesis protein